MIGNPLSQLLVHHFPTESTGKGYPNHIPIDSSRFPRQVSRAAGLVGSRAAAESRRRPGASRGNGNGSPRKEAEAMGSWGKSGKWVAKCMGSSDSNATNHAIWHNLIVLNPVVKGGVEGMMKHRSHVPVVGLDMFGWESLPEDS